MRWFSKKNQKEFERRTEWGEGEKRRQTPKAVKHVYIFNKNTYDNFKEILVTGKTCGLLSICTMSFLTQNLLCILLLHTIKRLKDQLDKGYGAFIH